MNFYSSQHKQQRTNNNFNPAYLLVAAPLLYQALDKNEAECEEAPRQDRIRGSYENKIRFFSPPEKIFETFAHGKDKDGDLVMSYQDFFRALTPYNFTEIKDTKEYFEKYHPEDVLKVADTNNDGVISFPEFMCFITILQLPEGFLEKEFRKLDDPAKGMSKEIFSRNLNRLRSKTAMGHKQTNKAGKLPDARKISAQEEDFQASTDSIV
jgi:hypothetical protein